jgi:hypothetical protein
MYTHMKKGPEGPLLFFWLKYVVPDVLPPLHHYCDHHHMNPDLKLYSIYDHHESSDSQTSPPETN